MAQSFKERRAALAALGFEPTPQMVDGTIGIAAPDIDPAIYEHVGVAKDLAYGPHERNVLDVYSGSGRKGSGKPVLVYVHGGGFVRGAKASDQTPYFRNLGAWAARQGWVAVVINYRLAPEHRYPSAANDVRDAIAWVVERIAEHGGDPAKIFLCGQSAGAVHAADYVVGHGGLGPYGRALAGAIIVSGIYDASRASHDGPVRAYWGNETNEWGAYGTLQGLIDTDLPLLLTVSELDGPEFQDQAAAFVAEWHRQRGTYAPMHLLYGQNHLTPVYGIGSRWDELGAKLRSFIEVNT